MTSANTRENTVGKIGYIKRSCMADAMSLTSLVCSFNFLSPWCQVRFRSNAARSVILPRVPTKIRTNAAVTHQPSLGIFSCRHIRQTCPHVLLNNPCTVRPHSCFNCRTNQRPTAQPFRRIRKLNVLPLHSLDQLELERKCGGATSTRCWSET